MSTSSQQRCGSQSDFSRYDRGRTYETSIELVLLLEQEDYYTNHYSVVVTVRVDLDVSLTNSFHGDVARRDQEGAANDDKCQSSALDSPGAWFGFFESHVARDNGAIGHWRPRPFLFGRGSTRMRLFTLG